MKLLNKIKKKDILYFLGVLIIGVFLVLVVRITYAFLAANINEARENVTLNSDDVDKLEFAVGDPLKIDATPTTLPENGANLVSTTTASSSLLANTTNNTAEHTYFVYFNIPTNTFVYSDGSTPEIILTITDPNGSEVTNIDGLTYGTFNGVSGFDITTKTGLFTVANSYTITSNSSKTATTQTWNFKLTYLNLSFDQSLNFGKRLITEIQIQKEEHKETFADYIISTYDDGSNGLYYHDTNLENGAADNSYRYAGANPNNYVCFGSDAETCPSDNLYRIIGVFDNEVKLIKADYLSTEYGAIDNYETYWGDDGTYIGNMNLSDIGVYVWGSGNDNTWSSSTIRSTLNTTYYNSLSATWQNKIATHIWKVGGMAFDDTYTAKQYYDVEVGSSSSSTPDSMKIGLMYVNDYGFAASPDYWTTTLWEYNLATSTNWLYLGSIEWTISPYSSDSTFVFLLNTSGNLDYENASGGFSARPVFYLNPNVTYVSGDGTESSPYKIS